MKKNTFLASLFALMIVITGCSQGGSTGNSDAVSQRSGNVSVSVMDRPAEEADEKKEAMLKEEEAMAKKFIGGGTARLVDVAGGTASGTARLVFTQGKTEHHAIAENLPELKEGYFYEGWLVKNPQAGEFFSTGEMFFDEASNMWELSYATEGDKTDHLGVVITLEPRDDDPAPAGHILDGKISFDESGELE